MDSDAVTRLVSQVEQIVAESGDPERTSGFDPRTWVAEFLEAPARALGGRRPSELMGTAEGERQVADLVARMQSGAYT
jgi:hypothetical protein